MIVGDWGTTRLRLFRLEGERLVERLDGPGIGRLAGSPDEAFSATIAPWIDRTRDDMLLLCGMAGSRNGLVEAPYAACPAGAAELAGQVARTQVAGMDIAIVPGLSTANFVGRPDVMRGEETQIIGALRLRPALSQGRQLLVLPGTHSKWAELADGRVERFHSFFTGEMFALLRDHSTLTKAGQGSADEAPGFADGLARAAQLGTLGGLFEARAAQLVERRSLGWATAYLSGLLIGGEVADGLRLLDRAGVAPLLIGDPALCDLYRQAFAAHDIQASMAGGDECVIAGLVALKEQKESE
jgi:2-dehydro-3-deoxygalactonokinase